MGKSSTSSVSASSISTSLSGRESALVARWLGKLIQHFGIHTLDQALDANADQTLAALISRCGEDHAAVLDNQLFLSELKRRIIRLAGARLDDAFLAMASDVVSEDDVAAISLVVEARRLEGICYLGKVYRLVDSFEPCYRLQAFCLGQTLAENNGCEGSDLYLITRSAARFAVWLNVRGLCEWRYCSHLPSNTRTSNARNSG